MSRRLLRGPLRVGFLGSEEDGGAKPVMEEAKSKVIAALCNMVDYLLIVNSDSLMFCER